jgi:hypothetical protein
MPEILKLDPGLYSLRHIRVGDSGAGTGNAPALANSSSSTLFGKSISFEKVPISDLIASPDLVSGTWTARLGDAGTWQIQVPNKIASDGVSWKDRFCNNGRVDWLEIKHGSGNLEFVGVVESIVADYQSVTVSGHDGFWCLKSQYERDWQCLQAPRDVMEHASRLAVPLVADTLQENSLAGTWSVSFGGGAGYTISSAGLALSISAGAAISVNAPLSAVTVRSKWAMAATVQFNALPATAGFALGVYDGTNWTTLNIYGTPAAPTASIGPALPTITNATTTLAAFAGPVSLVVECDGRWIRGYVDGQLIGYLPAPAGTAYPSFVLSPEGSTSPTASVVVTNVVFEQWKPFLMAGSDQGDYVLPGSAETYPTGGLHARYYNDVSASGLSGSAYLAKVLTPAGDNPAAGTPAPYDVIESSLTGSQSPASHVTSGFAATNWSAKYFGAVWLPLALGNMPMAVGAFTGAGVRVWIGKTQFGTQLVDQWNSAGGLYSFTVTAANYANGARVVESGWYPIVIEYAAISATEGPSLYFGGPSNLPFGWTDPGGTVFRNGEAALIVPATSLSPLGCVDQRYQGISYFDMYQQTGNAFGYQFTCEPQQLESGCFPGNLCPRIREGHDTDEVLEADLTDGVSPVINYQSTSDATDQCSSMYAIGAGINDGLGSQLQAQVYALANMETNLFDLQGWIDASDVSYESLLAQRAASQLALQEAPWENLTGDPRATDRLADTFPLTGVLAEFHWRPGDGVRFDLPDVNVVDAEPRQMTQVTRTFGPTGRTASSMQPGIAGNLLKRPT